MAKCKTLTLYTSLEHCTGQKVLPGVRQRCYYISRRDIVKYPTLAAPAADSTPEKLTTYVGSFTQAAGTKWLPLARVPGKGNIECEPQGSKPSVTYLCKFTATHPTIDEDATAFARMAADDDFVFLIQTRSGRFRVLGGEAFPAEVKAKLSTGEGTTGEGGLSIEIEATDLMPAPFYVGDILTADGTIKAATGEVSGGGSASGH